MTRDEYAGLIAEQTQSLYYIACSILPVQADREDALQNCVVKGLTKCESLRDIAKFRPWITRILVNECYTLLRQKKRLVLQEDIAAPSQEGIDLSLHDAVRQLPDKLRIPFIMQLEGYAGREIAQALRIPEGTVRTRVREAKRVLREALTIEEEVFS